MIFFDIDGTLVDHEKASAAASLVFYDQFAALLGGAREEFPLLWEATLTRHFKRFCRGEISLIAQRRDRVREVFNDPALSDEEVDRRHEAFAQVYESSCCLFDDVLPCLTHLGHSRLGVISNGGTRQQRKKLRQNGLLENCR
jgi:putative hydrolase of the HAD superfamily